MEKVNSDIAPGRGVHRKFRAVAWFSVLMCAFFVVFDTCATASDYYGGQQPNVIGGGANDNSAPTVDIHPGASPLTGPRNLTVISYGNGATITVDQGAIVQGNANTNNGDTNYGTGPNVIELNNSTKVYVNGIVQQLGSTTNGEAINFHGSGNLLEISKTGTVYSANGAAIWFQDTNNGGGTDNKVVNYGTITTGRGAGFNVFGSSTSDASQPGLDFENYGQINGSLLFGGGDDKLTLGVDAANSVAARPTITGNIDGGGGNNTLILAATNTTDSGVLQGAVKNFSTIRKTGAGVWLIMGQVPVTDPNDPHPSSPIKGSLANVDSITVEGGMLSLLGANPDFDGDVAIRNGATLLVQAQGISSANNPIKNGGTLVFDQPFNDTFALTIEDLTGLGAGSGVVVKEGTGTLTLSGTNTYTGGTKILEGALAISSLDNIGSGGIQFLDTIDSVTNSTLVLLGDIDMSGRTTEIKTAAGATDATSFGTIDTNGHTFTTDVISGTGGVIKAGEGALNLTGASTYTSTTNITGGMLQVDAGGSVNNTSAGNIYNGTLRVLGSFGQDNLTTTTVYQGNNLDGYGNGTTTGVVHGDVVNASGSITPGITGDNAANVAGGQVTPYVGKTLTITGNYTTSNGPPS